MTGIFVAAKMSFLYVLSRCGKIENIGTARCALRHPCFTMDTIPLQYVIEKRFIHDKIYNGHYKNVTKLKMLSNTFGYLSVYLNVYASLRHLVMFTVL